PIARVLRDVRELARVQAEVQRVEHEARARNAEVALEMRVVVPAQRRDAVAALEPEPLERDRELLRAPRQIAVRVAVEGPVRKPCHDLLVAEVRLGAPEQRRQRQLVLHHLTVHQDFPNAARRSTSAGSTMWPSRST